MVHVVTTNELSLQYSMEDKMSSVEEKKQDADFLPSMGLGALLTNPDDAKNLMSRIRRADGGMTLPADNRTSVQKPGSTSFPFQGPDDPLRQGTGLRPRYQQQEKTVKEPKPGPSHEPDFPKGKITGKTTPIDTTTINMEQLTGLNDSEFPKNELYHMLKSLPELEVKQAEYTRFRYASERPEKGKKVRQYEMDEDKRFVADVKVTNYRGSATVIMHCVDSKGRLHPYHLDGDDCFNGVFYKRFEFSPKSCILRILKATVIQPKAKEYKKSLAAQKAFLLENKAIDGTEQVCENPEDKQCVHFHVKVYLDDADGYNCLNEITNAIRNKKDGHEFKIYNITPPSASATGEVLKYLGDRVHIIVTNETAFPKEVSVVIRHKETSWEKELYGNQINVLKKAVVEFIPPPYPDTNITENVVVEVCLKDRITGKETNPVNFMYIRDEYGLNAKRKKKRKIEDLQEEIFQSSSGSYFQAQKKFVSDLSRATLQPSETVGPDQSNSSDEETPQNSLGYVKENDMAYDESQSEQANIKSFNKDVSLGYQRTNRSGNHLQQTAIVMETQGGVNHNLQLGNEGNKVIQPTYDVGTLGQVVTTNESILNNPSSQAVGGQSSMFDENSHLPQVQDQSAGIPQANFNPDIIKELSPERLIRLVNLIQEKKVALIPEFENLVWQLVTDLVADQTATPSQYLNQTAQIQNVQLSGSNQPPAQPVQSLSELPDLPADYQYAIIQGQLMVVKNDLHETHQSAQCETTNMLGQNDTMAQQPNQQTNQVNLGDFTQNLGEQGSSVLGGTPGSFVQTNPSSQPRQPPAAFWRATTGTSSNLDDDDVEIDTVIICPDGRDTNGISNEMEKDESVVEPKTDSIVKIHRMKLRGKKINYKDTLLGKKELYAGMDKDDLETVDDDKYKPQKQKNTEKRGKKSQRGGKALYEDDGGSSNEEDDCKDYDSKDEAKEEEEYMVTKPSFYRFGKVSKGKDLKQLKKMIVDDLDESSQGFDCSDDS